MITVFIISASDQIEESQMGVFSGTVKTFSMYKKNENDVLLNGGFLVGDDAFPLKMYLLKLYSHKPLIFQQKSFNYRLSKAQRIVENAFWILASRFSIFQKHND